jgi:PAS domain S-box-containing protein
MVTPSESRRGDSVPGQTHVREHKASGTECHDLSTPFWHSGYLQNGSERHDRLSQCAMKPDSMAVQIRLDGVFHQVIEAVPNAMVVVDGNRQIVMINAQVGRIFGYGGTEIVGCPIEQLVTERVTRQDPELRSSGGINWWSDPMEAGNELCALHKDNGIGWTKTIGLQLVELLAIQLDCEISIHCSGPTQFSRFGSQSGDRPEVP